MSTWVLISLIYIQDAVQGTYGYIIKVYGYIIQ